MKPRETYSTCTMHIPFIESYKPLKQIHENTALMQTHGSQMDPTINSNTPSIYQNQSLLFVSWPCWLHWCLLLWQLLDCFTPRHHYLDGLQLALHCLGRHKFFLKSYLYLKNIRLSRNPIHSHECWIWTSYPSNRITFHFQQNHVAARSTVIASSKLCTGFLLFSNKWCRSDSYTSCKLHIRVCCFKLSRNYSDRTFGVMMAWWRLATVTQFFVTGILYLFKAVLYGLVRLDLYDLWGSSFWAAPDLINYNTPRLIWF